MRRKLPPGCLVFLVLVGVGALLAGCQARDYLPRSTRPVIKIGLVAPFEGLLRWEGYRLLYAVKLALQEANDRGGVAGYAVELVALNDGDDPRAAARCAGQMVVDGDVVGVIGHFSDRATLAAVATYDQHGLSLVAPLATARELETYDRVFLLAPSAQTLATQAVRPMEERGDLTASTFEGDEDWPSAWGWEVRSLLAGHWVEARASQGAGPLVMGTADTLRAMIQVRNGVGERLRPRWGSPDVCHPTLASLLGGWPEETYCQALAAVDPHGQAWRDFAQRYQAYSGMVPTVRAGLAYDAARVLLLGMEEALREETGGSPAEVRERLWRELASVQFSGVSGPVAFDAEGRRKEGEGALWLLTPRIERVGGGSEAALLAGP